MHGHAASEKSDGGQNDPGGKTDKESRDHDVVGDAVILLMRLPNVLQIASRRFVSRGRLLRSWTAGKSPSAFYASRHKVGYSEPPCSGLQKPNP